jgi:hypothetical protein
MILAAAVMLAAARHVPIPDFASLDPGYAASAVAAFLGLPTWQLPSLR